MAVRALSHASFHQELKSTTWGWLGWSHGIHFKHLSFIRLSASIICCSCQDHIRFLMYNDKFENCSSNRSRSSLVIGGIHQVHPNAQFLRWGHSDTLWVLVIVKMLFGEICSRSFLSYLIFYLVAFPYYLLHSWYNQFSISSFLFPPVSSIRHEWICYQNTYRKGCYESEISNGTLYFCF